MVPKPSPRSLIFGLLGRRVLQSEWNALNNTLDHRLNTATPFALPCFSSYDGQTVTPQSEQCLEVQQNYTNPYFRAEHFGAYMTPNWETCPSINEECLLDLSNTSNPSAFEPPQVCHQGSIPEYYIDVQSANDVKIALDFSKRTGVPLVVKNTGHDYQGRSSQRGALALWTHHLNSISYKPTFIPEGCNTSYHAFTLGAGAQWENVYLFADANNVTIVGGYHQTVGTTGWLMGGGHSNLTPTLGLGVDRVLEFKIVTPDGVFRTANACQNSDLFWALRGGGPGFGVVLEQTTLVEPHPVSLQVAFIKFDLTSTNGADFLKIIVNNTLKWGLEGWGGHMLLNQLTYVTPKLTLEQANTSFKVATDFALSQPGGSVLVEELPSWWAFFDKYVAQYGPTVGYETVLSSRIVPGALFETASSRDQIHEALLKGVNQSLTIHMTTPFTYPYKNGTTSVTPAWRGGLWHITYSPEWVYNSTKAEQENAYQEASLAVQPLRDLTPGQGAYQSEADVHEPDHEESFWGRENYKRLAQIKKKYDPHHLFDCWHCVGWRGSKDPLFSCYI